MSTLSLEATPRQRASARHVTFRILSGAIGLLLLVGFGAWRMILIPWIVVPDGGDHGWQRTPELHRLTDGASGSLMAALGIAALVLAVRPQGRSAVTSWLLGMLALFGISSLVSTFIQGLDLRSSALFTLIWIALVVVLPWFFAPDRASLVRGGGATNQVPGTIWRITSLVLLACGTLLTLAAIGWRLAGGVFENPAEDDVVGLALLGIALGFGGWLVLQARQGWRTLGIVVAALLGYAVLAVASMVVSGGL